jgi:hypothetical protein
MEVLPIQKLQDYTGRRRGRIEKSLARVGAGVGAGVVDVAMKTWSKGDLAHVQVAEREPITT